MTTWAELDRINSIDTYYRQELQRRAGVDVRIKREKLNHAMLNLSSAKRCNFPEYEIALLESELSHRQLEYRPYCEHDFVPMDSGHQWLGETGPEDNIIETGKCCICDQDQAEWNRAQSTGVDVEDLLP
jgi:hypothetical protein